MSDCSFGDFLEKMGLPYDTVARDTVTIYRIEEYEIPHGRYAGKAVAIGIPVPQDFPNTAPYGLHVKSNGVFDEPIPAGDNPSPLGSEWKFWSRNVNDWNDPASRTCRHFLDHANRWLEVS